MCGLSVRPTTKTVPSAASKRPKAFDKGRDDPDCCPPWARGKARSVGREAQHKGGAQGKTETIAWIPQRRRQINPCQEGFGRETKSDEAQAESGCTGDPSEPPFAPQDHVDAKTLTIGTQNTAVSACGTTRVR